ICEMSCTGPNDFWIASAYGKPVDWVLMPRRAAWIGAGMMGMRAKSKCGAVATGGDDSTSTSTSEAARPTRGQCAVEDGTRGSKAGECTADARGFQSNVNIEPTQVSNPSLPVLDERAHGVAAVAS